MVAVGDARPSSVDPVPTVAATDEIHMEIGTQGQLGSDALPYFEAHWIVPMSGVLVSRLGPVAVGALLELDCEIGDLGEESGAQ